MGVYISFCRLRLRLIFYKWVFLESDLDKECILIFGSGGVYHEVAFYWFLVKGAKVRSAKEKISIKKFVNLEKSTLILIKKKYTSTFKKSTWSWNESLRSWKSSIEIKVLADFLKSVTMISRKFKKVSSKSKRHRDHKNPHDNKKFAATIKSLLDL